MNKDRLSKCAAGSVEVFTRYAGKETVVHTQHNLVVYGGMDITAKALANVQYINGMYLAFTNAPGGAPPFDPVTVARTANLYQTSGSVNPLGFVRVATLSTPEFGTSDDTKYDNNTVQFTSLSDGNVQNPTTAAPITDGVSVFYGAGLVWRATLVADDVLFSAVNFEDVLGNPVYIPKVANAQVGVRWLLTMEV